MKPAILGILFGLLAALLIGSQARAEPCGSNADCRYRSDSGFAQRQAAERQRQQRWISGIDSRLRF